MLVIFESSSGLLQSDPIGKAALRVALEHADACPALGTETCDDNAAV